MNPGKKKKKSPDTFVVNDIRGTQTPKHTEEKMTRFFSLKGTKSTPIFIKPNAKSPLSGPKTK